MSQSLALTSTTKLNPAAQSFEPTRTSLPAFTSKPDMQSLARAKKWYSEERKQAKWTQYARVGVQVEAVRLEGKTEEGIREWLRESWRVWNEQWPAVASDDWIRLWSRKQKAREEPKRE